MPTVTYKCGKTGKTKKRTFAYNAVGKAQSAQFAKLMKGRKKNNPGPGSETLSTSTKTVPQKRTMTKEKFVEQAQKSAADFAAKNKGLKNIAKRARAKQGVKQLEQAVKPEISAKDKRKAELKTARKEGRAKRVEQRQAPKHAKKMARAQRDTKKVREQKKQARTKKMVSAITSKKPQKPTDWRTEALKKKMTPSFVKGKKPAKYNKK
jgi:hypothetical protein